MMSFTSKFYDDILAFSITALHYDGIYSTSVKTVFVYAVY